MTIDFKKIEQKWQKKWESSRIFEADIDQKKKFFITVPYPYVNGAPHIGAGFTFFRGDVYARFKRMQGFNVLYPQGFHATGEPIVGAIERLKKGDEAQMDTFKMFGATGKDIEEFKKKGPEFVARFWMKRWVDILKRAGFSNDWSRTFITALTPTYNRFIEWQYNTLRAKGYVTQGTHPVIWCPKCQSPTGDHDRLEGVGESPIEFAVIKFKLDSEVLPCGTLRPETVYGVTNIWVNPNMEYLRAKVDDEVWILSKEAVKKFKDQLKKVEIIGKVKGSELLGKYCENPVTKNKIIILPADFVDPSAATGIVMSVPAHAPYDWIAIEGLKGELKKFGIEKIEPISIIETKEFNENPAKEACEKFGVKTQKDKEKLDKATELVYKKEFHLGICKSNCGEYSGLKVSECKERLTKEFVDKGFADVMWESTAPVVCRCTTPNHVKILEDQWFLKFSDPEWKARVRACIDQMKFYPEEARQQFLNTVDWLRDKACARKTGLGTKLPWDKEWIVETLSDSVIYMAYYAITKIIEENKISPAQLTDEVFDYVFLGEGDIKHISKDTKLNERIIKNMREQFEYFYPVDLRTSGKDLLQNHLTFFLFHHVAMWDSKRWPKAIGVNGYVSIEGEKMSKSLGNIIPLEDLIKKFGSDLVRVNLVSASEGMHDADWREENVSAFNSRIKLLSELVSNLNKAGKKKTVVDAYLQSRAQMCVREATKHYEEMKFRSATQSVIFDLTNDIKWYIERNGMKNCNKKVLNDTLSTLLKLMSPIMPHIAEELWHKLNYKDFVSTAKWPAYDEKLVDKKSIELENILKKTIEDMRHVIKLAGKKESAYLYVASPKEFDYFTESLEFLKRQFAFKKLMIFKASDPKRYDPQNKASKAKYGKPGIYLE